jgi:hypothetical protein
MNTTHHPALIGATVHRAAPGPLTEQRLEDRTRRLARRRHLRARIAAVGLRAVGQAGA